MIDRDDDQLWLDALAGRVTGDSPTQREASTLRHAMIEREGTARAVDAPARDAARETVLVRLARHEGLIGQGRNATGGNSWWSGWSSAFAVAALAGIAILIGFYGEHLPGPEVVRGTPDGIVRLESENPGQLKQQIVGELHAAGVQAIGYELLGRHGIDADLPKPLTDEVRQVLERHSIPAPADGVLRVEITARESR